MQHKVTVVVYRIYAASKNRTQPTFVHLGWGYTYRVDYRCQSVSIKLTAENVRFGNKYFLTSTSTSTNYQVQQDWY